MLISERKFKQVFPSAIDGIYAEIAKHIEKAGCKTKEQQAMFLASMWRRVLVIKPLKRIELFRYGIISHISEIFYPTQCCALCPR